MKRQLKSSGPISTDKLEDNMVEELNHIPNLIKQGCQLTLLDLFLDGLSVFDNLRFAKRPDTFMCRTQR